MGKHVNDLCAVVAGGSAGIGRAVVGKLVGRGYRVAVLARGPERLGELEATYGSGRVRGIVCDVSDASAVASARDEAEAIFGPPAVWINCAMLTSFSPCMEMEEG